MIMDDQEQKMSKNVKNAADNLRYLTPLWEVFIRPRNGLAHRHVGSVHAAEKDLAMQSARDVYTRRGEGLSIWVVRSCDVIASDPKQKDSLFEPGMDKIYRHPTFYDIPDDVGHM